MQRVRRLLAPLRSRDFVLLWVGQGISKLGDRCSEVALVWLILGLTGSSVLLGAALGAMYLPTILLLLFGGVIADGSRRRGVLLASDALRAVVILAFAVLTTLEYITLPMVFGLAAFYGLVGAFYQPALGAVYPAVVRPEHYDAANALRQFALQAATLAGPALGGYLVARWSVGAALAFDAATFGVAFLAFLLMRRRAAWAGGGGAQGAEAHGAGAVRGPRWREWLAGVRFLWREPGVLALVLFFSLVNGINNVEAVLVPRLVRVELGLSAADYGLLGSWAGLGALGGALAMGLVGGRVRRRAQVICVGIAVFGMAIAAMGLADGALTLDAAYLAFGVTFVVTEIAFGTLLQRIIPAEMRGRVFSVVGLVATAMNPPGFLLAGYLGDAVGPRMGLEVAGGVIALLSLLTLLVPAVRALNTRLDAEPAAQAVPAMRLVGSEEPSATTE